MNTIDNIYVLSRLEIEDVNSSDFTDNEYVISITDPDSKPADIAIDPERVLRLEFYDISSSILTLDNRMFDPMTEEQAQAIVDFVNKEDDQSKTILVHCEAGISRSAGVAAAISKHFTGDDSWYFAYKIPNMHCYNLVLKMLKGEK